jgi:hypothetical protein
MRPTCRRTRTSPARDGEDAGDKAHPLDSPDIVYIDGVPCNSACQSYMKWSRQQTSPATTPVRHSSDAFRRISVKRRQGPGGQQRVRVASQAPPMPPTRVAEPRPAGNAKADSELARASSTASAPADGVATRTRTLREQVAAATTLAERVTMADAEELNTADRAKSALPGDAEQSRTISSNAEDNMIALVMARSDIKSVADLARKLRTLAVTTAEANRIPQCASACRSDIFYNSSSVQTLKLTRVFGPKVCVIGTSAASRPWAIRTRPIRGMLLRGSKVYQ